MEGWWVWGRPRLRAPKRPPRPAHWDRGAGLEARGPSGSLAGASSQTSSTKGRPIGPLECAPLAAPPLTTLEAVI